MHFQAAIGDAKSSGKSFGALCSMFPLNVIQHCHCLMTLPRCVVCTFITRQYIFCIFPQMLHGYILILQFCSHAKQLLVFGDDE